VAAVTHVPLRLRATCQTAGVPNPPRLLLLWDVDHTLIETRGVGSKLYRAAFEQITGRPMEHKAEITGRTERAILAETLRLHGLQPSEEFQARYAVVLAQQYGAHTDELRQQGRALPGAAEALYAVTGLPSVLQTVLTGNLRAVTMTKLRAFDLDHFLDFEIGAYADDEEDRPKLVAIAQRRAETKHHVTFDRSNTVIVGDSPSDVETGAKGGAEVVAVASGKTSRDELLQAGASTVLNDLRNTTSLVDALRTHVRQDNGRHTDRR
jgi:phosphoglycolate phosphatase